MRESHNNRVLVTGGAGFIGSHLCDRLVQEGYSSVTRECCRGGELRSTAGYIFCSFESINHTEKTGY